MPEMTKIQTSKKSQDSNERVRNINLTLLQLQRKAEMRREINHQSTTNFEKSLREEFFEGIKIV